MHMLFYSYLLCGDSFDERIVHTTLLEVIEGLIGNILQAILGWER